MSLKSPLKSPLRPPLVVLVRPQMGENIGASARAMLNCGLSELRLVAPRDGWPNPAAKAMAAGADAILERAQVFPSLREAVADCQQVFASSARRRDQAKPLLAPEAMAAEIGGSAALVFGPEANGLENDEIAQASHLVQVPLNPAHSSLNLAQAVLLLGYTWWRSQAGRSGQAIGPSGQEPQSLASAGEVDRFVTTLLRHLRKETTFLQLEAKRVRMERNIRNIFTRHDLSHKEVQTLYGVVEALRRGGRQKD